MRILRFGLLLLIAFVGLASLAAAADPVYTHSFEDRAGSDVQPFAFDSQISDTVTVNPLTGTSMAFSWYAPPPASNLVLYSTTTVFDDQYYNVLPRANKAGTWQVAIVEFPTYKGNTATFTVSEAPEFIYGSFISLFLVSGLYLILRRNLVGSFNVNR